MNRFRFTLVMLTVLASLQFASACSARDLVGANPRQDAANGATVGGAIGGPQGAAIASALWVAFGVVVRHLEKRKLRRKGLLTDRIAKPRKVPPHDVSSESNEFPQQHI